MGNHHNREKMYYEIRARLTLQALFPSEFSNITNSDMPDLIDTDSGIGIEVTRAISSKAKESSTFFTKKLQGESILDIPEEKLSRFKANGYNIIVGHELGLSSISDKIVASSACVWHTNNLVVNAIEAKLKHINSVNYQPLQSLNLYVFTDSFKEYEKDDVCEIVKSTMQHQNGYANIFRNLYIDDCGWFYSCCLSTGKIEFFSTEKQLDTICPQALAEADK